MLYFTPADSPVSTYVLEYGTKAGEYSYGILDMNVNSPKEMTFLVKSLFPNTLYYFKIRAGNGCAIGPWSNEISAKTKGVVSFNQLNIINSQLKIVPIEKTESVKNKQKESQVIPPIQSTGYDVNIIVVDINNKPVEGAIVTMHSKIQEAITDKNGVAKFKSVETGNHKVLIAYKNFEGEQSVNLTGNVKRFELNVTISPKTVLLSSLAYGIIGTLILVIIILASLLLHKKFFR